MYNVPLEIQRGSAQQYTNCRSHIVLYPAEQFPSFFLATIKSSLGSLLTSHKNNLEREHFVSPNHLSHCCLSEGK